MPLADRHCVAQWWDHWASVSQSEASVRDEQGVFSVEADPVTKAMMVLAYDLYIVASHARLQESVLKRLRRADQFRGVRYELVVAATLMRAGFRLTYEDETDPTSTHPEFVASHPLSGIVVDVETKARHRRAIDSSDRAGAYRLLRDAAKKRRHNPLVVFVELALSADGLDQIPTWVAEVQADLVQLASNNNGVPPLDFAVFTNLPHQYAEVTSPTGPRFAYAAQPTTSRLATGAMDGLQRALEQYGTIPVDFPPQRNDMI